MLPQVIVGYEYDGHEIEIIWVDNKPLFNARMVAAVLGISGSAARSAVSGMEVDEDYLIVTNSMLRDCSNVQIADIRKLANRGEMFLTEAGVYEMTFRSRKPEAKAFKRWITREVLPSLREKGYYGNVPQYQIPQTYADALQLAADQQRQIETQKEKILQDAPRVEFYNQFMDATGTLSVNEAGKVLGIGQNKLFAFLRDNGVLINKPPKKDRDGKISKRYSDHNTPKQEYMSRGWFRLVPGSYDRHGAPGEERGTSHTTKVTPKGLYGINRMLAGRLKSPDLFHRNECLAM